MIKVPDKCLYHLNESLKLTIDVLSESTDKEPCLMQLFVDDGKIYGVFTSLAHVAKEIR